ncbi:unnamed protein product [Mytilus coruscus]|uniref:Uncharacterized protein n=1 Tax=Mytilus coruscus TaxID=42192 RepID=A0A6J8BGQ1_MYTCO|nr:unnamed protein product [Mytilus coruscus]
MSTHSKFSNWDMLLEKTKIVAYRERTKKAAPSYCYRDSPVPYDKQSWDCKGCGRYNELSKDGDLTMNTNRKSKKKKMSFIQGKSNIYICVKFIFDFHGLRDTVIHSTDFYREGENWIMKFYILIGCVEDLISKRAIMKPNYILGFADGVSLLLWFMAFGGRSGKQTEFILNIINQGLFVFHNIWAVSETAS